MRRYSRSKYIAYSPQTSSQRTDLHSAAACPIHPSFVEFLAAPLHEVLLNIPELRPERARMVPVRAWAGYCRAGAAGPNRLHGPHPCQHQHRQPKALVALPQKAVKEPAWQAVAPWAGAEVEADQQEFATSNIPQQPRSLSSAVGGEPAGPQSRREGCDGSRSLSDTYGPLRVAFQ